MAKENPLLDPRCCTYKMSKMMKSRVENLVKSTSIEADTKSTLIGILRQEEANKKMLTYDSLVKLHKYIQRADRTYIEPFYLFLESFKCIEPKPRENKQLEKRLNLLRFKSSQLFYNKMTAVVDRVVEDKIEKLSDAVDEVGSLSRVYSNLNNIDCQSQSSEFRRLNGSLVAVFNSFLVFICTFIFCYKALEYSLSQPNIIAQVLFGLAGSTVVAIAELYFLFRVI